MVVTKWFAGNWSFNGPKNGPKYLRYLRIIEAIELLIHYGIQPSSNTAELITWIPREYNGMADLLLNHVEKDYVQTALNGC